jgi:hypothetical protein
MDLYSGRERTGNWAFYSGGLERFTLLDGEAAGASSTGLWLDVGGNPKQTISEMLKLARQDGCFGGFYFED